MKRFRDNLKYMTAIAACFAVVSMMCSCKTKTGKNDYCVKVIQNSPNVLPENEMIVIKSLFNSNRMDAAKYQFYQLDTDELGFKHVRGYQYVNNLKVFSEALIFHFNQNDSCYSVSGVLIQSTGLDAKPSLNQDKAVEVFIKKIAQEKASMVDINILKGCFEVEFGYVGLDDSKEKFAKVWKVKPADKDFPYAYIQDDNAEIFYYDNGVRY